MILFAIVRRRFFQLLDDLQHAIAAHDGIINDNFSVGVNFNTTDLPMSPWMRMRLSLRA